MSGCLWGQWPKLPKKIQEKLKIYFEWLKETEDQPLLTEKEKKEVWDRIQAKLKEQDK